MANKIKIGLASDFAEKKTFKFQIPDSEFQREGFAFQFQDQLFAYFNECAHIALPLDWDDNDFFAIDDDVLVCKNHGAEFQPKTGECTAGPCVGAKLKKIETQIEDGIIFAIIP